METTQVAQYESEASDEETVGKDQGPNGTAKRRKEPKFRIEQATCDHSSAVVDDFQSI
jgi:hypothetical protein